MNLVNVQCANFVHLLEMNWANIFFTNCVKLRIAFKSTHCKYFEERAELNAMLKFSVLNRNHCRRILQFQTTIKTVITVTKIVEMFWTILNLGGYKEYTVKIITLPFLRHFEWLCCIFSAKRLSSSPYHNVKCDQMSDVNFFCYLIFAIEDNL